ncbi:MAG: Protease Do [Candidatus Woesebacteria bacterium GW2011_GWC2_45_9]|uniref:Protease Do n=1 Tax=Candidatus Woesebacteria bacterium GW2011_GWC2_45_9 TaxID=1618589 RepID=A0A0G1R6A4_9BACT|nr:MAG: Protease Do [Candidatus Woesebacteria bacterium GW2011_GWC2_45_9]
MSIKSRKILIFAAVFVILLAAVGGGAVADRLWGFKPLDKLFPRGESFRVDQRVVNEESVVIKVAEEVSPSVVTVSAQTPARRVLQFNPFGGGISQRIEGGTPQDIGTGFVVSEDGLVVTNKHVVSVANASYKVITKDGQEYEATQISRDPSNDIAIIKIDASGLKPAPLGDSSNLKVGQFVVAIGTALGEFRHTVTTGVISGLGRGITAGSSFEGYVERLDDVIQTDAAINPGNSGGPLVNSAGQVIGINVAVAQGAQNIGFSIPINVVKEALSQFKQTGKFPAKPYLGVQYQMISQQAAVLNNVPQGAYVVSVIAGSPAESAGMKVNDIIKKFDGQELTEEDTLADAIKKKSPGEAVELEIWRDGETLKLTVTLSEFSE